MVLLALLMACSGPHESQAAQGGDVSVLSAEIEAWLPWKARDLASTVAQLGVPAASAVAGRAYGNTSGLSVVHAPEASPAHFYFDDGQLALIYFPEPAVQSLDKNALAARFEPAHSERSRVGKQFMHHVAAGAGVAWSADSSEVGLLELFEPGTVEVWKKRWYEEVTPYRK
jgi:hypothetical protein